MRPGVALAALLGLSLAAALSASAADLRRLESVGVVGIRAGNERSNAPRDGAVRAAVARAVETVARDLLPEGFEADPPDGLPLSSSAGDLSPGLARVLGEDPFDYATRFRIVEDRGLRGAMFSSGADIDREYVVLVEVFVDESRVRDRLHAAGWLEGPSGDTGSHVRLVVEGLESFAAYDALRRTLLENLDVRSALPVELSRGRAVLEVDGTYDAASLLAALVREARDGLQVVPLERDERTLTLLVEWNPPAIREAPADDAAN